MNLKVGRVSPLRAVCALPNCGAHGVTRPTGSWAQCMRKKPERGLSMIQRNCLENSCSICYTNLSRLVHSPNARPQGREGFP